MEGSTDVKQQAQYIWNRLDDLAATDPQAYKNFIDKQMKEKEVYMSNPKAEFCVHTSAMIHSERIEVYLNICSWKRMPDVKSDHDPVQLHAGKKVKHHIDKNTKPVMCIPIAVNDRFFSEVCQIERHKRDFIGLCLELVRRNVKVPVSSTYTMHKEVFMGVFPANPRSLFVNVDNDITDPFQMLAKGEFPSTEKILSSPESLLENLSLGDHKHQPINDNEKQIFDSLIKNTKSGNGKKKKLIEEIDSEPCTPEYVFVDGKDMKVKISLPLLDNMQQCDVNISKKEIQLVAEEKYKLHLQLPKEIDDEKASARFNRKTSNLTLTAPYLTAL